MRIAQISEGKTKLCVPAESLERSVPPTSPVFFNPAASTNRDVSVAFVHALGGERFCDALAGVGARGLRVAREGRRDIEVTMVEFNRDALKLAERSASANKIVSRCRFVKDETRAFLFSKFGRGEKFDYVDIDPFGSPAPYLPAMISACKDGAIASVTATDTAALCGVYPLVCRRRYGSKPLNNAFHHETAVRILFNAIRSQAGMLDRGVVPLAAHSTRHYIRVFARIEDGAAKADGSLKGEGYVNVCSKCGDASTSGLPGMTCERCGGKLRTAGPMWTGKMTEPDVLSKVSDSSKRLGLVNATRILDGLSAVDSFPPWSYRIDDICSELKLPTAPDHRVRQVLKEAGYRSSKQPFEKTGLKTDAPISAVKDAVRQVMGKG